MAGRLRLSSAENKAPLDFGRWRFYLRQMAATLSPATFAKDHADHQLAAVEAGLPVKMLRVLMRDYGFTLTDFAEFIASRRTLERRISDGERLSVEESERLGRLLRMIDLAVEVFKEPARTRDWLRNTHSTLKGRSPLELMRTENGGRLVEEQLLQLKWGFFA